jgi:hypothetical protein
VILFLSFLMVWLTMSTARNYRLADLPMRDALLVMSSVAAVVGFAVVWVGPTPWTRGWVGGLWMAYSLMRASAFGARNLARTETIAEFLDQSSPIVPWVGGWFLGFLVWHRRLSAPYDRASE